MSFRVRLPETGEAFDADDLESLLNSALRAGVKLPCDCRQGACGTCRVRLLEGTVEYDEEPMALSPAEAAAGFALACQARPASDLAIQIASTALQDPVRQVAVIRRIDPFAANVIHLELDVAQADYLPGQYMKVHLGDGTTRNFSMASMPRGSAIDFHVRRISGGRFTERMLKVLKPGDRLDVELPLGSFFFRRQDYRPLLMVATGTGLAPIRSILESLLDDPDCPSVNLYWGMRTAADLYLHDEIQSWSSRLNEFRYVPVLSRADGAWTGRRGHVQDAVAEDFADLSAHAIYLCGAPDMIGEASKVFVAKRAGMEHLYADSFHFQYLEELT
jgi:CDP-4-dehydro-6-deoxyglucose reductase